ncbi:MAG: hypothetical protein ACYC3I_18940 [Gemmataceae bacterium]
MEETTGYEGNPVDRTFAENLLEYAVQYRLSILGELAGMIERWKLAGLPNAKDVWPADRRPPRHRWQRWADRIGGILAVNGFTQFLSNVEEARAAMDEGLQALATLAEYAISKNVNGLINPLVQDPNRGKLPREWATIVQGADVFRDKLADKNAKARDTWIGTYLSGKTDRAVPITIGTSSGTAILRRNLLRSDQKRYYFEIAQTSALPDVAPNGTGDAATGADQTRTSPPTSTPSETGVRDTGTPAEGRAGPLNAGADTGNDLDWV